MKLGVFMMPLHPPEKSRTDCYDEDLELLAYADELGYSEGWVGNHVSLAWEPIVANDIFLSHAFARTKNIRLGLGVVIVPQDHPVNIASGVALLDHLSHGRLNVGFGQGGVPTDWQLFDLPDPQTQGRMTYEGLNTVLKLWEATAPFEINGEFWRVRIDTPNEALGMGQMLRPYQLPHPPIGISAIRGTSRAARMAGERGWSLMSTNLVPVSTVIQHWDTYRAGAQDAGRPEPSRAAWSIARNVFVGETTEEAVEFARKSAFGRSFEYMTALLRSADMIDLMKHDVDAVTDDEVDADYCIEHLCIVGDVDECRRRLTDVFEQTGGFGQLLMIAHDWDDREKWQRSMRLLADEVVPAMPSV